MCGCSRPPDCGGRSALIDSLDDTRHARGGGFGCAGPVGRAGSDRRSTAISFLSWSRSFGLFTRLTFEGSASISGETLENATSAGRETASSPEAKRLIHLLDILVARN